MKTNAKFIISGGGTGGHIYPAIAIANEIRSQLPDAEILFVGARDKMEMQKVPAAGYPIEGLWISGVQRKLTLDNALFPLKLLSSLLKSRSIIKRFRPDVVIGTGGFASGAVVKAAQQMGIPTVIQEQNSYPGITNKMLAPKADAVCVAYDGLSAYFKSASIIKTGNPVRQDLLDVHSKKAEALAYYQLQPEKRTVVILGGSLGARRINQLVEKELPFFKSEKVQVIWQCGKLYSNDYMKYHNGEDVFVYDFIERMDLLFAAADVIISRAGASSVSELAIVGKPVIFIPSPNVAEDHQTKNARSITDKNAAVLIRETDLDAQFEEQFKRVLHNETVRSALSHNLKMLALPNATKDIVNEIFKLVR